jgi:3-hydroxybutyrate dehydrogenase
LIDTRYWLRDRCVGQVPGDGCIEGKRAMTNIMMSAGLARSSTPRPLDGKVAVVTGSTSGIGLGIATELAAAGATIVLNGFGDPIEIEKLCHVLGARHDVPVRYDDADMSDAGAIHDMMERVGRSFGPVDILVNNAGIQHVAPVDEFPPEKWDAILAINLSAAFHATRAVLPEMKRRGFGRIINIASAHGLIASPFKSAYVAAKHGVVGLTKVVALEAAEHGVTCNAVCPGYVWTPLVEKQVEAQAKVHGISRDEVIRKVFLAEQPTRRFATVEEIAGIVVFLCGSAAASVTGVALPVDGGWTAH